MLCVICWYLRLSLKQWRAEAFSPSETPLPQLLTQVVPEEWDCTGAGLVGLPDLCLPQEVPIPEEQEGLQGLMISTSLENWP